MKVDTVRAIDRIVGVPLCALATLLRRARLVGARPPAGPPRRALFIELSEMGSAVLSDPAMRALRRATGAELYFVIFERNRDSLDLLSTVAPENVFTIRGDRFGHLAIDTLRFVRWARRRGIDTAVDLELFSRYSALLSLLSGAGRRVGFHRFYAEGLYRGELLTHPVLYNPHQHIAKNFLALVRALLAPAPEVPYSKTHIADSEIVLEKAVVDPGVVDAMRRRIAASCAAYHGDGQRVVLINANASALLPQRRWPQDRYARLAEQILAEYPHVVVLLTGAAEEREELEGLQRSVNDPRCASLAGQTAIRELPALFALSSALVTNDSGLAQFAGASNLPVFVLFGPETPTLYLPLGNATPITAGLACSPCVAAANHRRTPCTDNRCLQAIEVEQVLGILRANVGERLAGG